ncbi:MAG: helix-hairpin-helix domain-containing protein [Rhizobacter sp.]|nr:helix-hairpin-helix domain-containing protein [Ferruginibacter sp.]
MSIKPNHNYLDFTRKDRRGTIALLLVILLIAIIPFVYPLLIKKNSTGGVNFDATLASLQTKQTLVRDEKYADNNIKAGGNYYRPPSSGYPSYKKRNEAELFNFDPNTLSEEGWKKLGLRDKTIATIMNYRSKGGKFKQAEDIKKIWGLFPDEAAKLVPYVNIKTSDAGTAAKNYSNNFSESKKYDPTKSYAPVDINVSDTSAWIALPGIGSKLSQRIISFRDKLGGFYAVGQVAETFGLADSTYQKIKPFLQVSGDVKKININTATVDELKKHPYIRYQLGNAILQYRTQHGNYKSVYDIKKIMIMSEDIFNKLSPYLAIE